MNTQYLLGIDIGTTATKVILCDLQGNITASASRPSTLYSEHSTWAEEDANQWWRNVCEAIPDCLKQAGVKAEQIAAVGTSGMVPTIVLLDENGDVIRRSIQQNDARSFAEIDFFKSECDEQNVFQRTGAAITQQSIGPKLLWLKKNENENFRKARLVMGSYDFINYRLTGSASLEQNWVLESGLFNLSENRWDAEILMLSGISESILPPARASHEIVGKITQQAASQCGLLSGTPVVAGSADHVASAFSAGLSQNGDLLVKLGGAGDILYSLDHLIIDERLFLDYHLIPGSWLINGCMASSGSIIKWFRNTFGAGDDYPVLDQEAAPIKPGSDGLLLLPYFIGEKTPIFDPLARGMFFGSTLQHSRAHYYHAILEGISFAFYHHIEVLKEMGLAINKVRVTNGGARSQLWRQVTADVIGYPLENVKDHPGSSLGAAFTAGMGVGAFENWNEIEKFIKIKNITQPNPDAHEKYMQFYPLYRELYETNKENFKTLAKIEGLI